MKNIQSILKNNIIEGFQFKKYSIFSLWFQIIVFTLMSPIIFITVIIAIQYQILVFIYKLFEVPSKYIKDTINENKVSSAPLFVVYLISYPVKFYFDILIAIFLIILSFVHLFFVSFLYVSALGGIKFQPYLYESDGKVEKNSPSYKLSQYKQKVFSLVLVTVIIIGSILPLLINGIQTWNDRTIRFETGGGSLILDRVTTIGDIVSQPKDPVKFGYVFDGWYVYESDNNFSEESFKWPYTITKNITLYAKWIKVFTITFDSNGGTPIVSLTQNFADSSMARPNNPTKTGFTFGGWYLSETLNNGSGTLVRWPYVPKEDVILYARWIGK